MESDLSIEGAAQFSAAAEIVADIVHRGVEAFQRLAEAIGRILEPMRRMIDRLLEPMRHMIDRLLVRLWSEIRSPSVPLPHTRHAMRARKIGRVLRVVSCS